MKDGSDKAHSTNDDISNMNSEWPLRNFQIFELNNVAQVLWFLCKNKLDFNTKQEIITQNQNVLKDKQLEQEQEHEIVNVFQKMKKEKDKKIAENKPNEIREQKYQRSDSLVVHKRFLWWLMDWACRPKKTKQNKQLNKENKIKIKYIN